MNLDEKLRAMVLQEFGFSEAITDNTISDIDLKLIQKSTNDGMIQEEIINIFKSRIHAKVIKSVTKYNSFQHVNGFAAARARSYYKNELENILETAEYLSDKDKKIINVMFTK